MKIITVSIKEATNAKRIGIDCDPYDTTEFQACYQFNQRIKDDRMLIREGRTCYVHSKEEKRALKEKIKNVKFKEVIIDGEYYPGMWIAYI